MLLEFDSLDEAKWVLENGRRSFRGDFLHLEWWNPTIGCARRKDQAKEAWIRVLGLPLNLWTCEIFRMINDSCGGYLACDKDTTLRVKPLWARIMVKLKYKDRLMLINILARSRSFEL